MASSPKENKQAILNLTMNRTSETSPPPFEPISSSNNKKRPAVPVEEIQDVREPAAKKRAESSSPSVPPPDNGNNNERPSDVLIVEIGDSVCEPSCEPAADNSAAAAAVADDPVGEPAETITAEGGVGKGAAPTDVTMGLKPGDRIEVRWDLRVEKDSHGAGNGGDRMDGTGTTTTNDDDNGGGGKTLSRWWGATLLHPDGREHVLADVDVREASAAAAPVRVLDYDSRHVQHEYGYTHRASLEDVVFLSNHKLLHLSHLNGDGPSGGGAGGGRMYYRREGSVWDPPSAATTKVTAGELLDSVLIEALHKMSDQTNGLDATQRRAVATRIADAREKMLAMVTDYREGGGVSLRQDL